MADIPGPVESSPGSPVSEPVAAPGPPPPAFDVIEPRFESVMFTGTGGEYFRIWIVNLALTVITLGVYSAWAKVRRLQYFYRHTRLDGSGFDYHGNPIAILKGRIIGLVLLGLYSAAGYMNFWIAAGIFLLLAVVMPWLLGRSLAFRLHNSSYRGLRFRFHGTARQAYVAFLAYPIVTVLTLFTLGPLWHHRLKRYQFVNAAYGRSRFSFNAAVGEFYVTYILAVFVFIGLMFVFVAVIMGAAFGMALASGGRPPDDISGTMMAMVLAGGLVYAAAIVAGQAIITARIQNECWNKVTIEGRRFHCQMYAWRLFSILFTNLLGTVATIGLYRPFAQVRLARYVASTLRFDVSRGFDVFVADDEADVSAVGEETTDLFDFDIAF